MAFTFKDRRLGYDNIAIGSATGQERVIEGGGVGDATTRTNLDSGGNTSTAALAIAKRENMIRQDGDSTNDYPPTPGATSASSGHTSNTSLSSVFPEVVG